jgi:hypothetical protein
MGNVAIPAKRAATKLQNVTSFSFGFLAILRIMRCGFRYVVTVVLVFGLLTNIAVAQQLEIGIKGGVPLLDAFETNASQFFHYTFNTKRYTVGPTATISLLLNLKFEADALYRRLDYDSTVMGVDTFSRSATPANSWEFPLLLKKQFTIGAVSPFGDAGYALRHVTGRSHIVDIVFPTHIFDSTIPPPELVHTWTNGLVAGGGVTFRSGHLGISPEIRYTRWLDPNFRFSAASFHTNQNQADFLLGLSWEIFSR